jgi:protein-L-isoaspartate(D-aspartate) O-methyltransferase
LAVNAENILARLQYKNIFLHVGDGSSGWSENAPYDRIMVTAAAPSVPPPLLSQLKIGGKLVLPIGDRSIQRLEKWHRTQKGIEHLRDVSVCFVPLRGKYGWS